MYEAYGNQSYSGGNKFRLGKMDVDHGRLQQQKNHNCTYKYDVQSKYLGDYIMTDKEMVFLVLWTIKNNQKSNRYTPYVRMSDNY